DQRIRRHHQRDRAGRRHLQAELVGARLDRTGRRVVARRVAERGHTLHDAGLYQSFANRRQRLAWVHRDLDRAVPVAGVVVGGLRVEDLAGDVDCTDDDRDHDQARGDDRERHLKEAAVERRLRLAVTQAEIERVHWRTHGAVTNSPGARPDDRSASRALCKIITAAAWSTTSRRALERTPTEPSCPCAVTVDNRSSTTRTGTGAPAAAIACA